MAEAFQPLVDTSALIGLIKAEPEATLLLDLLLHQAGIVAVPFDALQFHWVLKGWRRFGTGRHAAELNLGDCFAYGLAMTLDLPLLFKGEDFSSTDVKVAR